MSTRSLRHLRGALATVALASFGFAAERRGRPRRNSEINRQSGKREKVG